MSHSLYRTAFFSIFCFYLISAHGLTARPSDTHDFDKDKIGKLAHALSSTKRKYVSTDSDSRKLLGHLYQVNHKIRKMSSKRTQLTDDMLSAQGDASSVARSIVRLENRVKLQRSLLSRRLRTLYKMGEQGVLQAIFSSQTAYELDRNMAFLKKVTHRDYEIIQDFENNLFDLEKQRKKLRKNIQKLTRAQSQLKAQESLLEKEQKMKSRLLSQLRQARQDYLSQMMGIRKQVDNLTDHQELPQLLEESFFERKGTLPLPIVGKILQDYGLTQDEQYKFKLSHKGLFFLSPVGNPVHVVFNGTVQFAGPIDGYGKTIIIDHGDRFYSVYGNNRSLKVKSGQKISEGDIIAESGINGKGLSGLYFEIRHFSDSVNPKQWVAWESGFENLQK
ncbi:MAG: peptidoglycan DD-metalloendopeptidase family protein [Bdellovibrionales bacterium]|nr:peptidoglycan DD-metalloendopeptidase family protein [Bdellovibrionales bacterium]